MSAARARRRLMAFERYRRRAIDLGAGYPIGFVSKAHYRLWNRVAWHMRDRPRGWPWKVPPP